MVNGGKPQKTIRRKTQHNPYQGQFTLEKMGLIYIASALRSWLPMSK